MTSLTKERNPFSQTTGLHAMANPEPNEVEANGRGHLAMSDDVREIAERISMSFSGNRDVAREAAAMAITEDRRNTSRLSATERDIDVSRMREIETDAAAEGHAASWQSCSGCHETNEGSPLGDFSEIFQTHTGNGCIECGGLGVVWDVWTKEALDRMENEHASC